MKEEKSRTSTEVTMTTCTTTRVTPVISVLVVTQYLHGWWGDTRYNRKNIDAASQNRGSTISLPDYNGTRLIFRSRNVQLLSSGMRTLTIGWTEVKFPRILLKLTAEKIYASNVKKLGGLENAESPLGKTTFLEMWLRSHLVGHLRNVVWISLWASNFMTLCGQWREFWISKFLIEKSQWDESIAWACIWHHKDRIKSTHGKRQGRAS